ncbi:hypothetical protein AVEN_81046-1 [Araneus ventricosus]|uniref:Uncharacterized protein n=1 Tax=Araneus ventricosus TaxID=182803 RepID=A0A4Y2JQX8_ARAVE|nr:hypothetical protein AVEN_81046-1 [Araneus ventricosus]
MVIKLPLSRDVTDPICLVSWLLNRCRPSLINAVDILNIEFESVVVTGKIGEESYDNVLIKDRDYSVTCEVRKDRDFLHFRKTCSQSLATLLHLLQLTGIFIRFLMAY